MRRTSPIVPTLLAIAAMMAEDSQPQPIAGADETITVTSDRDDEFKVGNDGSAGKLGLPMQQDPQSRTALSRELLDARGAYSLREALRSAPGVTMAAGEGGRTGDSLNIRGFAANSDLYLDGLKDNGQYFRDTFTTASVEVLRGAAAVLFGRGATGGAVNTITRKPSDHWTGDGALTIGENGFLRATAGTGGPLVQDVLGCRLDTLYQTGGSFRDESHLDRVGVASSLAVKLGERTRLLGQLVYTSEESNMDYGVPWYRGRPVDMPVETYYGFKDDSFQEYEAILATGTIEQRLSETMSLRNTTRYGDYYRFYRPEILGTVNYATNMVPVTQSLRDNDQTNLINQTELTVTGKLLDRDGRLVLGLEFGREQYDFRNKSGTVTQVSVFDPNTPDTTGASRPNSFSGTYTFNGTEARSFAAYALTSIDVVPELKLVLGGRFDRFLADYHSGATNTAVVTALSRDDTMFSPRAGLVWTPAKTVSAYASYSTAFNPSAETFGLSAATANLDPEETRNIEVGVKSELFDRTLSLGLALFRLEKTNARTTDPNNTALQVLEGKQRTYGIEAEVAGRIGSRWTVQGGVALLDAEVTKSNNTTTTWDGVTVPVEGLRVTNTPQSSGSLWVTCDIGGGLSASTGFYAAARRYVDQGNSKVLPGYVRADASIAYVTRWSDADWRLQLNVINLFDTVYYEAAHPNFVNPGTPLGGQLTLSVAF